MAPTDRYLQIQFALLAYEGNHNIKYTYSINPLSGNDKESWIETKENPALEYLAVCLGLVL